METHNRFLNTSTTGITILKVRSSNNRNNEISDIEELVSTYYKKLYNCNIDSKELETFHMLLCYKYQLLFNQHQKLSKPTTHRCIDLSIFFPSTDNNWSKEDLSLLYDIAIIYSVIYSTVNMIVGSFKDYRTQNNDYNVLMKVSEWFVDSYNLHSIYYAISLEMDLEQEKTFIMSVIKVWLGQEELQWKYLALLLPKLCHTFGSENIAGSLWNLVFTQTNDLSRTLAALCVMSDVFFPIETENITEIHGELSVRTQFWLTLTQGLRSLIFEDRKQALYLLKRSVDFVQTHELKIRKRLETSMNIVPFVSSGVCRNESKDLEESSVERTKKHFFLILEVLEEKQKHLVLPALSHLPSLVEAWNVHKYCGEFFNVVWLRSVFIRILHHDNESVRILGIGEVLKADLDIFDEEFMILFVTVLNNTYLYEFNPSNEVQPKIINQLTDFLVRCEDDGTQLINTFLRCVSMISWGVIPVYWILYALRKTTGRRTIITNQWGTEEMKYVLSLVESITEHRSYEFKQSCINSIVSLIVKCTDRSMDKADFSWFFKIISLFPNYSDMSEENWDSYEEHIYFMLNKHLSQIIKSEDALLYVAEGCKDPLTMEGAMKTWAITIYYLLHMIEVTRIQQILSNLFENLINFNQRPYADSTSTLKLIELHNYLFSYCRFYRKLFPSSDPHKKISNIMNVLRGYIVAIIKIVHSSLDRMSYSQEDAYISGISYNWNNVKCVYNDEMWEEMTRLKDKCIQIIDNPQNSSKAQWSYAIKLLTQLRKEFSVLLPVPNEMYIHSLYNYYNNESIHYKNQKTKNNVSIRDEFSPDCADNIAWLIYDADRVHSHEGNPLLESLLPGEDLFKLLQHLVENESEQATVFRMISKICDRSLSLVIRNLDSIKSIIRTAQLRVYSSKKRTTIENILWALWTLLGNSKFFPLNGVREIVIDFISSLVNEGDRVEYLKEIAIKIWSLNSETVTPLVWNPFKSCLLHGAIPRGDQRIEQATKAHAGIEKQSTASTIRQQSIIVLLNHLESVKVREKLEETVLTDFVEILKRNINKRYFDNSHLHRLKHRIMQTFLVLEKYLSETSRRFLHDEICNLLIAESNQPSVRLMQEWLLIRIHKENSDLRNSIWTLFETATEKRSGSIVSVASIVFHISRLLAKTNDQLVYVERAISYLLPHCMGQQFNVRLYSQTILVKIYELLPAESQEAKKYKEIYVGVKESLLRGNSMKNSQRLMDDFYFSIFDADLDFNLETIFHQLPRLTNVANDEWIPFGDWRDLSDKHGLDDKARDVLKAAKPVAKSSRPTGGLLDDETETSPDGGIGDIQKKIIPWKSMIPLYDELSETSRSMIDRRQKYNEETGMIVVASLIDRPPNLGGLARTCEIFGAKELVIGSLRYVENREFQTLSVSADKWIKITEVKPHLLKNYLLEKQSAGWKLVGAEQTANSTNLFEMKFEKKTILILGNEKDGIPANLIPLLDTCVEIPQSGVVRSLNVHVTGAICIWEYARQHSFA